MPKWYAQYGTAHGDLSRRLFRLLYIKEQHILWELEALDPDNQYDDSDCPVDWPLN